MDIIRKLPLKRIKTFEGVIEQNTIDKIHHKVQANVSTIQSKLDGGQSGLPGITTQKSTYQMVTGNEFLCLNCPLQSDPVPP